MEDLGFEVGEIVKVDMGPRLQGEFAVLKVFRDPRFEVAPIQIQIALSGRPYWVESRYVTKIPAGDAGGE